MTEFVPFLLNVFVPVFSGLIFLALAKYVRHIAPMRTLVTGKLTYVGAFWGFLFLGFYLASRPLQIFLGPHPLPLIINNIREFFLIAVFGPAVFLAMMSLCFGSDKISRPLLIGVPVIGFILAVVFVVTNVYAIGGSQEIFHFGKLVAHDGLWFANPDLSSHKYMKILFVVRTLDPILLLLLSSGIVFWHAFRYPSDKRAVYTNMPKKLYLLSAATLCFALSMMTVGMVYVFGHIPNQWWIYYLGACVAGFLEAFSLSLPVRKEVQVSEHM